MPYPLRPPDRCRGLAVEDHRQGWRVAQSKTRAQRASLTVIFARRENARREEDGPVSSRGRGHRVELLRELPACGCGPADPVVGPRPEGSRPSGRGRPPAPESVRCPSTPPGSGTSSRASSRCLSVVARSRVRTRPGPDGLARRRRALEVFGRESCHKSPRVVRLWGVVRCADG